MAVGTVWESSQFAADSPWVAEALSDHNLEPGGSVLVAADFPVATYPLNDQNRQPIDSGILLGRTFAERDAGTGYGPADVAGDDEIFLLAFKVNDLTFNNEITLLRHRTRIYEDKLPNWATLPAATQTRIRELYDCRTSAPLNP